MSYQNPSTENIFEEADREIYGNYRDIFTLPEHHRDVAKQSLEATQYMVNTVEMHEALEPEEVKQGVQVGFQGLINMSELHHHTYEDIRENQDDLTSYLSHAFNGEETYHSAEYSEAYQNSQELLIATEILQGIGSDIYHKITHPTVMFVAGVLEGSEGVVSENDLDDSHPDVMMEDIADLEGYPENLDYIPTKSNTSLEEPSVELMTAKVSEMI